MFSISQIILIVLSFLLIGVCLYMLFARKKQPAISYYSLLRYFIPLLFVIFICSEITYFVYYSKFLYYFGINAAILIAVTFAILAIPVYGLFPKGKLPSIGLLNILKRKTVPVPKAVSIPIEIKQEELKITVEMPEAIQHDTAVPEEQKPEIKPAESIEKIEIVKEEEIPKPAELQTQETTKVEAKPVTTEPKKAAEKKAVIKKPAAKKEVKKTEVKKEEAKPADVKHVKTPHPKTRQIKTTAEKPKHTKQTKPGTKK